MWKETKFKNYQIVQNFFLTKDLGSFFCHFYLISTIKQFLLFLTSLFWKKIVKFFQYSFHGSNFENCFLHLFFLGSTLQDTVTPIQMSSKNQIKLSIIYYLSNNCHQFHMFTSFPPSFHLPFFCDVYLTKIIVASSPLLRLLLLKSRIYGIKKKEKKGRWRKIDASKAFKYDALSGFFFALPCLVLFFLIGTLQTCMHT